MSRAFEDPAKTEMRARTEIAIDAAGFEPVENLKAVPLPEGSAIRGGIKGDLQSLDSEGLRHCYYLRPSGNGVVPQWIASLATAAQELEDCVVYVVVDEPSVEMTASCKAAGAGLVLLTEDSTFEWLVDPSDWTPNIDREAFLAGVREVRRVLESKLDINVSAIDANYARTQQLTMGFTSEKRDGYIADLEAARVMWIEWGDEMSAALDRVAAQEDPAELAVVATRIESGPILEEDDTEDGN